MLPAELQAPEFIRVYLQHQPRRTTKPPGNLPKPTRLLAYRSLQMHSGVDMLCSYDCSAGMSGTYSHRTYVHRKTLVSTPMVNGNTQRTSSFINHSQHQNPQTQRNAVDCVRHVPVTPNFKPPISPFKLITYLIKHAYAIEAMMKAYTRLPPQQLQAWYTGHDAVIVITAA